MRRLLLLAGVFLALIVTVASNKAFGTHPIFNCKAPIIVSN
jgi:hypothetical protein